MTETSPTRPKRRKRVYVIAFAVLGVATFALLEVSLRLFMSSHLLGPAETHGYVEAASGGTVQLAPGFRGHQTIADRRVELRTNSDRIRGPELGPPEPGEKSVLVLGDSMTFGWGVEEEEAFPAQVGATLAGEGHRVTVMNGAIPGYGSREMALALERFDGPLQPDVVVACVYIGNDFEDDVWVDKVVVGGFPMRRATAEAVESSWRGWLAIRLRSWLLVESLWRSASPASNLWTFVEAASEPSGEEAVAFQGWPPPERRIDGLFMDREPAGAVQEAAFARLGESLDRMRAMLGARPLLVVIVPTQWHCFPELVYQERVRRLGLDPAEHRMDNMRRAVAKLAADRELPCVDLTPALSARPNPALRFIPGDRHLTPLGHRDAAAAIVPELRRLLGD